jgi:hypothetical protein
MLPRSGIARDADIPLTALVPEERTLEDVFMTLTAGTRSSTTVPPLVPLDERPDHDRTRHPHDQEHTE